MPTEREVLLIKNRLIALINGKVNQMCTGDFNTCSIGACQFYTECRKAEFTCSIKNKLKSLRQKKVRVNKLYLKFKGRKNPMSSSNDLLKHCEELLLQPIFEHDLIKGNEGAIFRIRNAKTMNQIISILDDMHLLKYGKRKNLPQK